MSKFLSAPDHFAIEPKPAPDAEVLTRVALDLCERYPDPDEYAAAMERLQALLAEQQGADEK